MCPAPAAIPLPVGPAVAPQRPPHATAPPLFRFGLLSDVQWADLPDGRSHHGTPRYYRNAIVAARRAVDAFRAANVDLALHLGDIVDYHNSVHGASDQALRAVVRVFDALERPVLHCIGNHCLYNAPRAALNSLLGVNEHKRAAALAGAHSYFSFCPPVPGFKFLVLDGYDISLLGWPAGHPLHEAAVEILEARNPNKEKNSNAGLEGTDRRFVKFGGGVGAEQLAWLESELAAARAAGERAIVCCHLCLHPQTCVPTCLLWNYEEVLRLLQQYGDVVAVTLSGHAHEDGYHCDEAGIHHRVCAAVLETQPGYDCYGVVSVWPDRVSVQGTDSFESGVYTFGSGSGARGGGGPAAGLEAAGSDGALPGARGPGAEAAAAFNELAL